MIYLMQALMFTAAFHFVYESIVAPEMRSDLRIELRRLREELRAVEGRYPERANRRCFSDLAASLEGLLASLDRFAIVAMLLMERESRGDPKARQEMERRVASLDQCDIPEVRDIRARSVRIAMRAVAINNGGLLLYTLPVALVLAAYSRMRQRFLRLAVQAIDFHQQLGSAHVRV
ncbi:MAG: hypothetical protein WDO68_10300 [Gammaproteobacteria bacterium]